jgi:hypothetical protein
MRHNRDESRTAGPLAPWARDQALALLEAARLEAAQVLRRHPAPGSFGPAGCEPFSAATGSIGEPEPRHASAAQPCRPA